MPAFTLCEMFDCIAKKYKTTIAQLWWRSVVKCGKYPWINKALSKMSDADLEDNGLWRDVLYELPHWF
jgi:hypothetical protein